MMAPRLRPADGHRTMANEAGGNCRMADTRSRPTHIGPAGRRRRRCDRRRQSRPLRVPRDHRVLPAVARLARSRTTVPSTTLSARAESAQRLARSLARQCRCATAHPRSR